MTVAQYQRSLIRRSYANDPVIQRLNAKHERDAAMAERRITPFWSLELERYVKAIVQEYGHGR